MTCDCHSYNAATGTTPEQILNPNDYFKWDSPGPAEICIDACIADEVLALWRAGVWTINSCCGHGRTDGHGRSIILANGAEAERARMIVKPGTRILHWKLGEHNEQPAPAPNLAAVATIEELDVGGDPFAARIRFQFNPVPVGETLYWSHPEPVKS